MPTSASAPAPSAPFDSQGSLAATTMLARVDVPEQLKANLAFFLHLVRKILDERSPAIRGTFDNLLANAILFNSRDISRQEAKQAFQEAVALIDGLSIHEAQLLVRAFTVYFHLANICEENYRVQSLRAREQEVPLDAPYDPVNDITAAFHDLVDECGHGKALALLKRLEFRPVFTAHPTEARRKAIEGKIRRIAELLEKRPSLGGLTMVENERRMLQEIDAMLCTSPIAIKKPTPVEEADTVIDLFDSTLFDTIPDVYRRFNNWQLGERAGSEPPICPAFVHPGSWIGSDRDGNPNVTAKVSRQVAEKYRIHVLKALADRTYYVGRNLTLDTTTTQPSDALLDLWSHQVEMSEAVTQRAEGISASEMHRAVMLVMSERLKATITRTADLMYSSADEFLSNLVTVQQSLVQAGAKRSAYGPVQRLIWQVQTFGFHLVEMEFRQHSLVHARALADIKEHGQRGQNGALQPMTREVLDTFRAIGAIQRRNGINAARRYIISFTQSAADVATVYELARLAFAHEDDVPTLDVIPLFEQVEDLRNAVPILAEMIKIPQVQRRLDQTGRRLEVMLGYSDSSKDAGPTCATFVLHEAQQAIAEWAEQNRIDLVLMHGRGGAVGRGGGPANRAVLSQPAGSVNCVFKLTEQGEVIFARYGDPVLARRHIESVAGATLLQSSPSIEWLNTETTAKYLDLAHELEQTSTQAYEELLSAPGFVEWFNLVTPLDEVGLMPMGSRPAKRGLGAKSLDDLRAIPWIFSWSQARTNLAAWYGLGSACEAFGNLELLREAYREWPLFTTFIDNVEMSLSKTDPNIARMYLALGDRPDLSQQVLKEMDLTLSWVLKITQNEWPLQNRHVLGPVVRMRLPFVDVLSLAQVRALRLLKHLPATDQAPLQAGVNHPEDLAGQASAAGKEALLNLVLCTVSGVAAGLQNTG